MEALPRFRHITPATTRKCASAEEVGAAIAEGRERGLEIAVRSGGHCFAGRSSTTGLLIDVEPLHDVELDGDIATIGAGAQLGPVYDALAVHGRTIAAGCGPDVGIAGLALGGGLGILGRRYGLTCDQMVGAQVVLADGRVVETDEQREPDLFWALRGSGGGQFGVVTRLKLRTVEAPASIECFRLSWPRAEAAALISEWQEWSPDASEDLAASLIVHPDAVHLFGAGPLDRLATPQMSCGWRCRTARPSNGSRTTAPPAPRMKRTASPSSSANPSRQALFKRSQQHAKESWTSPHGKGRTTAQRHRTQRSRTGTNASC